MKLLRPFTGTGAIFWPIGVPPDGTCEFATELCKFYCYAARDTWPNFDEELLIPEAHKQSVYKAFLEMPVSCLQEQLLSELDGLQTDILHWFGSGDCPENDTKRVLKIVARMENSCTQMGFTRNVALWEARKDVFALTVESQSEIGGRTGMFSVSDYGKGMSMMYRDGRPVRGGLCGPELCQDRIDPELTHFINCKTCKRLQMGCFDR